MTTLGIGSNLFGAGDANPTYLGLAGGPMSVSLQDDPPAEPATMAVNLAPTDFMNCEYTGDDVQGNCPSEQFCQLKTGECQSRKAFWEGTCAPIPRMCTMILKEVCGCDVQTYANECVAHGTPQNVASEDGACEPSSSTEHAGPDHAGSHDEPAETEEEEPAKMEEEEPAEMYLGLAGGSMSLSQAAETMPEEAPTAETAEEEPAEMEEEEPAKMEEEDAGPDHVGTHDEPAETEEEHAAKAFKSTKRKGKSAKSKSAKSLGKSAKAKSSKGYKTFKVEAKTLKYAPADHASPDHEGGHDEITTTEDEPASPNLFGGGKGAKSSKTVESTKVLGKSAKAKSVKSAKAHKIFK